MKTRQHTWAIVLAAGNGTRLASLSTDERGTAVPKQFCSLNGRHSLLHAALRRARRLVPRARVCTIVARQHERYWRSPLHSLTERNVIVEPRNCGTAIGVLHGVLRVLERDSLARILFMPADHHARNERSLTDTVRAAVSLLPRAPETLLVVGITPDEADAEFGYILPGAAETDGGRRVTQFVEKPTAEVARDLIARGAVWNSFIFAAHAATLIALIRARLPEIVDSMTTALARDGCRRDGRSELNDLYERLPTVDFSRSIMQDADSALRLFTAPACGWADLGTPRRVARVLESLRPGQPGQRARVSTDPVAGLVNLATQYARLSSAR
jgi:mannose-1-phosphate guanylyltransferase